LPRILIYIKLG